MKFQQMQLSGKVEIGVGRTLQLTEQQAAVRVDSLKKVGKDVYEVVKMIEFKAGEIIGVEFIEVPKADYPAMGIKAERQQGKPMSPVAEKEEGIKAAKGTKAAKDDPSTPLGDQGKGIIDVMG